MFFFRLKKNAIPLICQLRRLVFDQSSPVHPVSESRGGSMSVTDERTKDGRKSSCLISKHGFVQAKLPLSEGST